MKIAWGQHVAELDIPPDRLATLHRAAPTPPITDIAQAAAMALESPFEFPSLRRALTPEDHVVVAIEPNVPHTGVLLAAILQQLTQARIDPSAVTLLCLSADQDQSWIDELPDEFQEVQIETHHPEDRKKLAYLATTRAGRRIYLNRSLVDADQTVVLTRRRYDTRLGYAGAAGVLFPGLCETETAEATRPHFSLAPANHGAWKLRHEAEEVAYLLGAPFFLQVIEGSGNDILHIIGGSLGSVHHAHKLLDAAWHVVADEPADLVIASISGTTEGATIEGDFDDLAHAALNASRLVRPSGRLVVLTDIDPSLGPSMEIVRRFEDPAEARKAILAEKPPDAEVGTIWAHVAQTTKIYLLSRLPLETAEELYATPLDRPEQAQKLIAAAGSVAVIPDAHRTLVTVRSR